MNSNQNQLRDAIAKCLETKNYEPLKYSGYGARQVYRYQAVVKVLLRTQVKAVDFRFHTELISLGQRKYREASKWLDLNDRTLTAKEIEYKLNKTDSLLKNLEIKKARGQYETGIFNRSHGINEFLNIAMQIVALSTLSGRTVSRLVTNLSNDDFTSRYNSNFERLGGQLAAQTEDTLNRKFLFEIRTLVKTLIEVMRSKDEKSQLAYSDFDTDDNKTIDRFVSVITQHYYHYV
ncbi:hypothetical protein [Vibrio agarivorans]|uniref:Uncharacterized protein n=1 Tax=Vibrio agarivorans TaxID=153622 RepID=A0ABT7Y765_9VIBR|nr:hypothetical protein [Vibrio agarivorans]MDN2483826.1 hypothetical protein [Vibrio agarivorans]